MFEIRDEINTQKSGIGFVGHNEIEGTHNSADDGRDVVQVIREAMTDIMKELNGLRQVSHQVPNAHCTAHRLTHKHNVLHTSERTCHMENVHHTPKL